MVCTFFGHRECYGLEENRLLQAIENLIGQGVDTFYVGNHGGFDGMVHACLKRLSKQYSHIHYCVVLAYLPMEKREYDDFSDAIHPEGIELGPPKFAIQRRNQWMIQQSDYCLCYITHMWGGAYQFVRQAKHRGLHVINLGGIHF